MSRAVLHFVHANSYPSGTYRLFLEHLGKDYDLQALDLHAHDPRYPVSNGWTALAQELVDTLTARYQEPVILVGHSMGGMLSLMAAKARPDLVQCVILLDAPIVDGWRATVLRTAKLLRIDKHFSPARASEKRRDLWPNAEAAFHHYASKPMFAAWPQRVLRDYLEHGLVPHSNGVTLRFSREVETKVYRTLPHHIGALVRRRFPVPTGFIGGIDSVECRKAGLAATRRLVGRHFAQIPGGHLFPMEAPADAAAAVHKMIHSLIRS